MGIHGKRVRKICGTILVRTQPPGLLLYEEALTASALDEAVDRRAEIASVLHGAQEMLATLIALGESD